MKVRQNEDYTNCGKTIAGLIEELKTFENQQLEVRILIDGGLTSMPISILTKRENKYALIENCQEVPTIIQHNPNWTLL
ncbi:MAG: hypothetical protein H7Z20_04325 [Bdellovibrio sp.]|nr:hypothetical protein [Methylotenera sp.]